MATSGFQIDVNGYLRFLSNPNGILINRLRLQAEQVKSQAQANLSGHDFSGDLSKSLTVQIIPDRGTGTTQAIIYSDLDYAEFVENGTGPQREPNPTQYREKPPVNNIRAWAEAHGLNPYALAHSIGMNGTPAVHYMKDALRSVFGTR